MVSKLAVRGLGLALTASQRVVAVVRAGQQVVEEVALRVLSDEDLQQLTGLCYARYPTVQRELFPWEQVWFSRDLPGAPARLLLGGSGWGRELRALTGAGYELVAFDPLASPADGTLRLDYQGWMRPRTIEQQAAASRIAAGAPYDAVIFGWGSFTHIPAADVRLQVLQRARALARGPVLLSFWLRAYTVPPQGRAQRLGARLVGAAGDARRAARGGDRIVPQAGYVHTFTRQELQGLADEAGYRLEWLPEPYAHATLHPL